MDGWMDGKARWTTFLDALPTPTIHDGIRRHPRPHTFHASEHSDLNARVVLCFGRWIHISPAPSSLLPPLATLGTPS